MLEFFELPADLSAQVNGHLNGRSQQSSTGNEAEVCSGISLSAAALGSTDIQTIQTIQRKRKFHPISHFPLKETDGNGKPSAQKAESLGFDVHESTAVEMSHAHRSTTPHSTRSK